MAHTHRGWLDYTSDPGPFAGGIFPIKVDDQTAANNGGAYTTNPSSYHFWPLHTSDLRHVYGKDAGGIRDSCVCTQASGALYTLGATFSDYEGNNYIVNGLRAERFRIRDAK
jgi:hypothetical protein